MVEFRKRKSITTDTMVSQYFSDMYDGGTATADLLGGMKQSKYIIEADIASKPTFGGAELSSLELDFYVDSITIGKNSIRYPEVASYLFKESISLTEGYQKRVDEDILCYSSVLAGATFAEDIFNGELNSGNDASVYSNIKRTIFRESDLYTTVTEITSDGFRGYHWWNHKDTHTDAELEKDWGRTPAELGESIDNPLEGKRYVKIQQTTSKGAKGATGDGDGKFHKCVPNDAHAGIGYEVWIPAGTEHVSSGNTQMTTTEGYGTEATPMNTIFESIRGSNEFSDWDADDQTTVLYGVGVARFNADNFLTGAQSLEMFTFWTGDSTNKELVSYPSKSVPGNARNNAVANLETGPADRQEVVLVKSNIPYPDRKATPPSAAADGALRTVGTDHANDRFLLENHTLAAGTPVKFADISGIDTVVSTTQYYVANDYLNANNFRINTSVGTWHTDNGKVAFAGSDADEITLILTDVDNYDDAKHAASIEMDVNIKEMARTFNYRSVSGTNHYKASGTAQVSSTATESVHTLRRGFHIIFGTTPPKKDETLYDYVTRMANLDKVSGGRDTAQNVPYRINYSDIGGLEGGTDGETFWSVRGSGKGVELGLTDTYLDGKTIGGTPGSGATELKRAYFAGVSFLNIQDADSNTAGIQVVPWNGTLGSTSGNWKHMKECLYATDHDSYDYSSSRIGPQDLMFFAGLDKGADSTDVADTFKHGALGANYTVPMLDQWTRLTFAVSPTDSTNHVWDNDAYNTNATTAVAAKGHHSFGRLYLSNPSNGELVNPLSGFSANKPYVDLALMGNQGNFISYDEEDDPIQAGSGNGIIIGGTYQITTIDSTGSYLTDAGADANVVGEIFTATATGTAGDGRIKNLEKSPQNWPKHMSIWVTNYKSDRNNNTYFMQDQSLTSGTDTKTVVLIDSISFKDFNYDITNSSQLDEQNVTSPVKIEYGKALLRPTKDEDTTMTHINERLANTPALLSFGFTDRKYLSVDQREAGGTSTPTLGEITKTWTSHPYGLWLNDFSADSLSTLGDIPDANIKAGFSMSAYNDGGGTPLIIPLGHQFTQKGYDYTEIGETGNAGSSIPHNMYPNWEDLQHGDSGTRDFATTYLNTTLKIDSNDVSEKLFVAEMYGTGIASLSGEPIPIRVGDKLRLVERSIRTGAGTSGGSPTDTYTVATVTAADFGSPDYQMTFTVEETVSGADDGYANWHIGVNTPGLCRNFSQKGGLMAYVHDNEHCVTKRENIAASARITELVSVDSSSVTIQVDNTKIFDVPEDEEFIVYLYNGTPTFTDRNGQPDTIATDSADCKTGLKVLGVSTDFSTVTLNWPSGKDNAGTEILTYDNIHRLYISPLRYWLYVAINVQDSDGVALSPRSYGNVTLMENKWTDKNSTLRSWTGEALHGTYSNNYVDTGFANRTGLGTTYNEHLFNDTTTAGVNGAYINSWNLDRGLDHSMLRCNEDYGFGGYDEETSSGGHTGFRIVQDGQYNRIKMPKVVEVAGLEPTDTVNFLIDYKEMGISHKTTIRSKGHTAYPPYLFSVFEDELPAAPKLSVAPYKSDPFLSEFTYEASDSDLWYGLLHLDSKSINSQYHNAIFHLPLNEAGIHGATVGLAGNDLYYNSTDGGAATKVALFTYSGATIDSEGLAGNCVRFDGNNDYIKYTPSSGSMFANITNAASIVVHVVPDNGISGTENWIWKGYPFNINYDADNGKVVVDCYTALLNYVRLTSPDIITDGQTPTCIAVTIDPDLKSGNCKLFINGALVDQSGLISSSAPGVAGNNWHNNGGVPKQAFITDQGHIAATATITFAGSIAYDETITIISTDGTSRTYTARPPGVDPPHFNVDGGFDDKATALKAAIEHASGHNGKITVSQGGSGNAVLTLTQAVGGSSGNTTITENLGNTTKTNFTGGDTANATVGAPSDSFLGRIEELVIYNKCIYPIVPSSGKFVLDKPLKEIQNGTAISNNARLFVKDYHNIRGSTTDEVAASSPVSFRKAAFRLVD